MIIYVKVSRKVYAFKTKIIINHGCSSFEYNCTVSQKPTYAYSVERIIGYQSICKYIQKQLPNRLFSLSYRVRFSLYHWRLATKSFYVCLILKLNVIHLVFEISTLKLLRIMYIPYHSAKTVNEKPFQLFCHNRKESWFLLAFYEHFVSIHICPDAM